MRIRCRHCGLDMEVPSDSEGKTLRCPDCGETFTCRLPRAVVVEPPQAPAADEELVLDDEVVAPSPPAPEPQPPEPEAAEEALPDEVLAELSEGRPRPVVRDSPRQWYVLVSGVAAVALTYEELRAKAAAGDVRPKTKILYAPRDVTLPARDIPGLFPEADAKRREPRPRRRLSAEAAEAASAAAEALGRLEGQQQEATPDAEQAGDGQ